MKSLSKYLIMGSLVVFSEGYTTFSEQYGAPKGFMEKNYFEDTRNNLIENSLTEETKEGLPEENVFKKPFSSIKKERITKFEKKYDRTDFSD